MDTNGKRAGHVVVAGPGLAQRGGRIGFERHTFGARHDEQGLQRMRDLAVGQPEVAVLALHGHIDQPLLAQPLEMAAGRGGADVGGRSQVSRRAGTAIQQQAQHARAGRIGNGACDPGEIDVGELVFHDSL
ncbi:hypothetical protein G6F57_022436 [Rhizopus arrhizus]|nr:hypothetical protein G6F57_022436 [Rhizopus arrhizus]